MPLEHSSSKDAVGRNIKREMAAGKPQKQAIAIAMETQRSAGKSMGKSDDEHWRMAKAEANKRGEGKNYAVVMDIFQNMKKAAASARAEDDRLQAMDKAGTGEGSRGGHIIGHTKSGKPIYEPTASAYREHHENRPGGRDSWGNANLQGQVVHGHAKQYANDFTAEEHADAAKVYERHKTLLPRESRRVELEYRLTKPSQKKESLLGGMSRFHERQAHAMSNKTEKSMHKAGEGSRGGKKSDKACPPGSMAKANIKALARRVVDTGLTVNEAMDSLSDDADKTALLREMREIKKAGAVPMPGMRAQGKPGAETYTAAPVPMAGKPPAIPPPQPATAGQPGAKPAPPPVAAAAPAPGAPQPPPAMAGKPPMAKPPVGQPQQQTMAKPGAPGAPPTAKGAQPLPEETAGTHEYHRSKALSHLQAAQAHAGAAASAKKVDQAQDHANVVATAQHATAQTAADQMAAQQPIKKAGEGEGSRGGHIIGHTGSGKPIYKPQAAPEVTREHYTPKGSFKESYKQKHKQAHQGWSQQDHLDAARLHNQRSYAAHGTGAEWKAHQHAAMMHQTSGGFNVLDPQHPSGGSEIYPAMAGTTKKSMPEPTERTSIHKNNLHVDLTAEDAVLDLLERGETHIGGQHASLHINGRDRLLGMRGERMEKGGIAGGTIFQGENDAQGSRGGDDRESVARAQVLEEMVELDEAGHRGNGGLAQWFRDAWDPNDPSHRVPVGAVPGQVTTDGVEADGWRKSEHVEIIDDDQPYQRAMVRQHPQEHQSGIRDLYQRR